MRVLNITHRNCPDGFVASVLVKSIYNTAEVMECAPEDIPEIKSDYDIIIITDMAFSKEVLTDMSTKTEALIVLDHHLSNRDIFEWDTPPANTIIVGDMSKCGAMLTWNYLYPAQPPPPVVEYVDDRDRWVWKLPHSKEINRGLYELGYFKSYDSMVTLFSLSAEELYNLCYTKGAQAIQRDQALIGDLVTTSYYRTYGDIDVLFVDQCPPELRSDVGNVLAGYSRSHIAGSWRQDVDKISVSLRALTPVVIPDLIPIARGHPGAAGVSFPNYEAFITTFPVKA